MEIKKIHIIGIISGIIVVLASLLLLETRFFFLLVGVGIITIISPFVFSVMQEAKNSNEKEQMFLEFSRNLVESVKAGTPISKSIINVQERPYGVWRPHVKKLGSQIYMGIPLSTALQVFARDTNNKTISRAITLIGQAEKSGGEITEILESVAGAVNTSDKLKKERIAAISTLVVQGYIIFLVFMVIVLVMQFKIIPMLAGIQGIGSTTGELGLQGSQFEEVQAEVTNAFFYLILIQGFFSGLAIGKLAEGTIKAGVKHSFALALISFLVSSGANIFFK